MFGLFMVCLNRIKKKIKILKWCLKTPGFSRTPLKRRQVSHGTSLTSLSSLNDDHDRSSTFELPQSEQQ